MTAFGEACEVRQLKFRSTPDLAALAPSIVDQSNQHAVSSFLERLYPAAAASLGFLTLWTNPGKRSVHVPIVERDRIAGAAVAADLPGFNVYFGVGLRGADYGQAKRGGAYEIVAIPGLWLDIDILKPEAHAGKALPRTIEEAADLLSAGAHPPSMIVDSGWGIHCWWLFEEPLRVDRRAFASVKAGSSLFQGQFIAEANRRGLSLDNTADISRVLRLPGTTNRKVNGQPKLVTVLIDDGHRYSWEALVGTSRPAATPPGAAAAKTAGVSPNLMKRLLQADSAELQKIFVAVADGKPFVDRGGRNDTLNKACGRVAALEREADPELLAEIFRPSLEAMSAIEDDPSNPCPTVQVAADMIRRAQEAFDAKDEATKEEKLEENKRFARALRASTTVSRPSSSGAPLTGSRAKPDGEGRLLLPAIEPQAEDVKPEPRAFYTDEELAAWAQDQGTTVEELLKRWIVQKDSAYYIFSFGQYGSPNSTEELRAEVPFRFKMLGPRVELEVPTKNGFRAKTHLELMEGMTRVATSTIADLTIDRSYFDAATGTFHEAVCPKRACLSPVYNPKIQRWLELLGGSDTEKLLDWIATVTFLDRQTSALYLFGPPGTGKTCLATGLAKIWTQGSPTSAESVIGSSFNAAITHCPLICADERLPPGRDGKGVTAQIRELLGNSERPLKRKFMADADVNGCLRLIICANDDTQLIIDETLDSDAMKAVVGRFLIVNTSQAAADYLNEIGGIEGTQSWVSGGMIACHALWLAQNRKVQPGLRFLVEGNYHKVFDQLAVQGSTAEHCLEWVAGYLSNPAANINIDVQKLVIVGDGKILVNNRAIVDFYTTYVRAVKVPSIPATGRALSHLSKMATERGKDSRLRYHVLDVDLILAWAEKHQIGDIDAMRRFVAEGVRPGLARKPADIINFPGGKKS